MFTLAGGFAVTEAGESRQNMTRNSRIAAKPKFNHFLEWGEDGDTIFGFLQLLQILDVLDV